MSVSRVRVSRVIDGLGVEIDEAFDVRVGGRQSRVSVSLTQMRFAREFPSFLRLDEDEDGRVGQTRHFHRRLQQNVRQFLLDVLQLRNQTEQALRRRHCPGW